MFPRSLSGSVRLKFGRAVSDRRAKALAQRIARMLRDAGASNIDLDDTLVAFSAGLFRGAGPLTILFPFDAGKLQVEPQTKAICVRYRLNTGPLLMATGLLAALLGIALPGAAGSREPAVFAIMFVAFWLALLSLSYSIAAVRFSLWLRKGLHHAPELRTRLTGEPVTS